MKGRRFVLWSLLGGLLVMCGTGWAVWLVIRPDWPDMPDPIGRWTGGTAVVELLQEGKLGSAQVPAYVCSGSAADKAQLVEIEGHWRESFVDDVGPGFHVVAKRKGDGGACGFYLTAQENGKDLWLLKEPGILMTKS